MLGGLAVSAWVEIAIWNPDGSRAEMSGNDTRIAARWLAEQTGARAVTVRVGPRTVTARMRDDGLVEQDLGPAAHSSPARQSACHDPPGADAVLAERVDARRHVCRSS